MGNIDLRLLLYFILSSFFVAGCATKEQSSLATKWSNLKKTETYTNEKTLYKKRMEGCDFCWGIGLDDFLKSTSPQPDKKCIYPASRLVVDYDDGVVLKEKVLKQNYRQLKVLQVTEEGFVVNSPNAGGDRSVFVKRTSEENVVDGSFLDDKQDWQVYEYLGTVTYQTLIGSKTVHSFRRLTKEKLEKAREGLTLYRPARDYFLENQLWGYLGESVKQD